MDWRHMFCLWIPINKLSRQGNTIGNQDTKVCKLNKRNIQVIARFFSLIHYLYLTWANINLCFSILTIRRRKNYDKSIYRIYNFTRDFLPNLTSDTNAFVKTGKSNYIFVSVVTKYIHVSIFSLKWCDVYEFIFVPIR